MYFYSSLFQDHVTEGQRSTLTRPSPSCLGVAWYIQTKTVSLVWPTYSRYRSGILHISKVGVLLAYKSMFRGCTWFSNLCYCMYYTLGILHNYFNKQNSQQLVCLLFQQTLKASTVNIMRLTYGPAIGSFKIPVDDQIYELTVRISSSGTAAVVIPHGPSGVYQGFPFHSIRR